MHIWRLERTGCRRGDSLEDCREQLATGNYLEARARSGVAW